MIKYMNYNYIPYKPKLRSVLLRLGYNKKVDIDKSEMDAIEKAIEKASTLCLPKARCGYMKVVAKTQTSVTLENGLELQSEKLVKLLKHSDEVVIMAATLSGDVTGRIEHELESGDKVFAVILDAYASECVDDSLDYVMKFEQRKLSPIGKSLTKHRFSAGYGGLDITYQKDLFKLLSLDELDIKISDSFMLIPEKSVIAIAGIQGLSSK